MTQFSSNELSGLNADGFWLLPGGSAFRNVPTAAGRGVEYPARKRTVMTGNNPQPMPAIQDAFLKQAIKKNTSSNWLIDASMLGS
ncbi:MAG: hypothetical protein PHP70_09120 [Gallionella sp.]|nr:hypothetical protein [Gallionella sp.]